MRAVVDQATRKQPSESSSQAKSWERYPSTHFGERPRKRPGSQGTPAGSSAFLDLPCVNLEFYGQPSQAAQYHARAPAEGFRRSFEPQVWHPTQQGGDGDLTFHPGERRAQAVVDAFAESEVSVVGAGDVQVVGVREAFRVVVGGREHDQHHLPSGYDRPAHVYVLPREALGRGLDGSVIAQQLLDGRLDQGRVVLKLPELVGVLQQREHAV